MVNTKEYNKQYYQKNRDRILAMVKEKVVCGGCGRCVNKQNIRKHQQTRYHKSRVLENNGTVEKRLEDIEKKYEQLMEEHKRLTEGKVRDPRTWKIEYVYPEELEE